MAFGCITTSKALGCWLFSSTIAGSGGALAGHLMEKTGGTIVLEQEQHEKTAQKRNTILRKHGDSNLYLEYSHIDDEQKFYIFDPLSGKIVPYVYYLVNANGKIIRLSKTPLPKEHKGIYGGWMANEFKYSGLDATFYGYCHPKAGGDCNHLPEGWTRRAL